MSRARRLCADVNGRAADSVHLANRNKALSAAIIAPGVFQEDGGKRVWGRPGGATVSTAEELCHSLEGFLYVVPTDGNFEPRLPPRAHEMDRHFSCLAPVMRASQLHFYNVVRDYAAPSHHLQMRADLEVNFG